jgi:hypothetical protein
MKGDVAKKRARHYAVSYEALDPPTGRGRTQWSRLSAHFKRRSLRCERNSGGRERTAAND